MSSTIAIKIQHGQDIRRFTFDSLVTLEDLKDSLRSKLDLTSPFSLQYLDTDSDRVTIGSEEEFVEAKKATGALKLFVIPSASSSASSAAPEVVPNAEEPASSPLPALAEDDDYVRTPSSSSAEQQVHEEGTKPAPSPSSSPSSSSSSSSEPAPAPQAPEQPAASEAAQVAQQLFQQIFPELAQGPSGAALQSTIAETVQAVTSAAAQFAREIEAQEERERKAREEKEAEIRRLCVSGQQQHKGVSCDGCGQSPIVGVRFKCGLCDDFDLCEACEAKNEHPVTHPMLKIKAPRDIQISVDADEPHQQQRQHPRRHHHQHHPQHPLFAGLQQAFGGAGHPHGPWGKRGGCSRDFWARRGTAAQTQSGPTPEQPFFAFGSRGHWLNGSGAPAVVIDVQQAARDAAIRRAEGERQRQEQSASAESASAVEALTVEEETLAKMGFEVEAARQALRATGGDVEGAIGLLLAR